MESFRSLGKRSLQTIAQSRGIDSKQTVGKLRQLLTSIDSPYSLNPNDPQEEKILSLIGVSNFALSKFLNQEGTREVLLEILLDEPLTEKSKEIVKLSQSPLRALIKLSGRHALPRADLIRIILDPTSSRSNDFVRDIKKRLDEIDFHILPVPLKQIIIKKEVNNVHLPEQARKLILEGIDPAVIPEYLLEEIVNATLLSQRPVNALTFARRMITDPISELWGDVFDIIGDMRLEDLRLLVKLYGYSGVLTLNEIEFFFQRQYLRKHSSSSIILPDRIKELLIEQLEVDSFSDVEPQLTNLAKSRLDLFKDWIDYDDGQLQMIASGYGILLPYPGTGGFFWEELSKYLNIVDGDLEMGGQDIDLYSDEQLVRYVPTAPYGRDELIDYFWKYWDSDRIMYFDGVYYVSNAWERIEETETPELEKLKIEELIELLGYVVGTEEQGKVMGALNTRIKRLRTPPSDRIKDFLREMMTTGALAFGASDANTWSNHRRLPNVELYEEHLETLEKIYSELSDEEITLLNKFPAINFRTLKGRTLNVEQLYNQEVSWQWVETGYYYLIAGWGEKLENLVPLQFRKK